jgi:hypothetical protein
MLIHFDPQGTPQKLEEILDRMNSNPAVKSIMILACDKNGFTLQNTAFLKQKNYKPIFGGIFPGIIYGKQKMEKGTLVIGLPKEAQVYTVNHLSDSTVEYDELIDAQVPENDSVKTVFVFVDGTSQRISAFIDSLFNILGLDYNYIGGGAGSLSFQRIPCLFTNQGLLSDSAVLALTDIESGIGVSHGWNSISGPFKVTEVDRNVIKSLDWEPAIEVYRRVVEPHAKQKITRENFFDIAKGYPFGIKKFGAENIVRDPFLLNEDGSIVCVGEVPAESYVDILNGDQASLINAAQKALALAKESLKTKQNLRYTFFIDCISRVLFLGNHFEKELEAVYETQEMFGALTLGEIANNGKEYLEFYNKTSVIGALEAK